jgi:hypothetical protein
MLPALFLFPVRPSFPQDAPAFLCGLSQSTVSSSKNWILPPHATLNFAWIPGGFRLYRRANLSRKAFRILEGMQIPK